MEKGCQMSFKKSVIIISENCLILGEMICGIYNHVKFVRAFSEAVDNAMDKNWQCVAKRKKRRIH